MIERQAPPAIAALSGPPSASRLTTDTVALHSPDTHLALSNDDGSCRARCSLWWTDTPAYDDHTVGLVGHYAAADASVARTLLERARERLRDAGCTYAIGPMDGATWFTYRFVTGGTDRPPFFLEPTHPPSYPEHFVENGFSSLAEYVSAYAPELNAEPPASPPLDVTVRPLNPQRAEAELSRLYGLVTDSFAANFLYAPIAEETFLRLYQGLMPSIDPSLVRLVETPDDRLVGIAFLVPDQHQAARDETVDTVVAKTLAVHPDVAGQGLGSWLLAEAQWRARQQGYEHAVHALMHETNRSRRISRHYGDVIRRYTLFGQEL
ncbi:MAG: N-acetyltransferase family protein [Salinibacter sp.]|uniref:GNAT family N-acetyltransferase n=1 Tax=Salinibacter sp. TaxID=2065818 RepID=UPI0035D4DE25